MYAEKAMSASPSGLSIGALEFKKNGAEIQRAIDSKIVTLTDAIGKSEAVITEICKRREVDVTEVLASRDERTLAKYSTQLEARSPRAASALAELQDDLDTLRREWWGVSHAKTFIDDLVRVKRNLESARDFQLSYRELETLGF